MARPGDDSQSYQNSSRKKVSLLVFESETFGNVLVLDSVIE